MDNTTESINLIQYSILIILFNLGISIIICPEMIFARQNGWQADLFTLIISLITLVLLFLVQYNNYQLNMIQIGRNLLGQGFAYILAIIYSFYTIHLAALSLRFIADFLSLTIMPDMPIIIFTSLITLVAAYGIIMGIKTIGRLGQVIFPIIITIFILLLILSYSEYNMENLLPVKLQLREASQGRLSIWSFTTGNLILFSFLNPYIKLKKEKKMHFKYLLVIFSSLVVSIIIFLLRTLILTLVLGGDLVSYFTYPIFSMVGVIEVAAFLERLEAAFLIMWIATIFIKIIICYWIAGEVIAKTTNSSINNYVLPIGIIIVALSQLQFNNYSQEYHFIIKVWPVYSIFFLILIPCLLVLIKFLRGGFSSNN